MNPLIAGAEESKTSLAGGAVGFDQGVAGVVRVEPVRSLRSPSKHMINSFHSHIHVGRMEFKVIVDLARDHRSIAALQAVGLRFSATERTRNQFKCAINCADGRSKEKRSGDTAGQTET